MLTETEVRGTMACPLINRGLRIQNRLGMIGASYLKILFIRTPPSIIKSLITMINT